jgi:predicted DCC family thiol-disulfide oxidoreductase YuxK
VTTEITEYSKEHGCIFYDAECRYCTALARRFQPLLASRHFALLPLQTPRVAEWLHLSKSELLKEMRVLRPNGISFGGADALLEIARDFWWAWPLRQLGRVPAIRNILRAGYRWIARNRSCVDGTCEIRDRKAKRKFRTIDFLPLLVLPLIALFLKACVAPWVFMWAMAFALYFGFKWFTYRQAVCRGLSPKPGRTVAYLLAWPGMDAADFLDTQKVPAKPKTTEWLFGIGKMSGGAVVVWLLARLLFPACPILAGWIGMVGVVFILHFGSFHLLSLFWQRRGIAATPVMQNPHLATSLAEFWGRRWNTAFNELAFRFAYRPLRQMTTPATAMLLVFGLSGLIHDLLISLPAGGGYGLPTLYFLIQGLGTITERSRFGRRIGLGRGARGWLFTLLATVAPVFWLFHPQFIRHVILPMLNAIGAT